MNYENYTIDASLDAKGIKCPLPLLKTKQALRNMSDKQILFVETSDPGSFQDIPAFTRQVGHKLLVSKQREEQFVFIIQKIS